jgi:hypothetical protein
VARVDLGEVDRKNKLAISQKKKKLEKKSWKYSFYSMFLLDESFPTS